MNLKKLLGDIVILTRLRRKKISLLLLFYCTILHSSTPEDLFNEANKFYEQGNYPGAIDSYVGLISQGMHSPELFYNLGNTYYRLGKKGYAIFYYERAIRLSPRNSDIKFNLNFVRNQIGEQKDRTFGEAIFHFFLSIFSINELAWLVIIINIGLFLFLILYQWLGSRSLLNISQIFGLLLAIFGIWFVLKSFQEARPVGISINSGIEVRSGPGEQYSVNFTIPEGKTMVILQSKENWFEIGLEKEGLKGWIKSDTFEQI